MALSMKSIGASLHTNTPQTQLPVQKHPVPEKVPVEGKSFIKIDWIAGEKVSAGHHTTELFSPVSRKSVNNMGKLKPEWEGFICQVLGLNLHILESTTPFIKERLQKYTEMLGCRPVKFVEMWNACQCKAFIPQDVRHIANNYCRGRLGRFNKIYIKHLVERKEQIKQLESDGMLNVLPFFLYSNKEVSVKDFRKNVGKGLWKQLLKNSKSRNALIARANSVIDRYNYGHQVPTVQHLNSLPTGLIPTSVLQHAPTQEEAELFKRMRVVSNKRKQQRSMSIVRDTTRMSEDLGYSKLPKGHTKWKFSDWEQHHSHLQELINAKKYSKDVFSWTNLLGKKGWEFKDFTATLLDNAFDIKMEGESMSHCVASYSNRVMKKEYVAVSIKDNKGNRFSTLGLDLIQDNETQQLKAIPNQHYMKYNTRVTDKDVLSLEKMIIKNINKQLQQMEK